MVNCCHEITLENAYQTEQCNWEELIIICDQVAYSLRTIWWCGKTNHSDWKRNEWLNSPPRKLLTRGADTGKARQNVSALKTTLKPKERKKTVVGWKEKIYLWTAKVFWRQGNPENCCRNPWTWLRWIYKDNLTEGYKLYDWPVWELQWFSDHFQEIFHWLKVSSRIYSLWRMLDANFSAFWWVSTKRTR